MRTKKFLRKIKSILLTPENLKRTDAGRYTGMASDIEKGLFDFIRHSDKVKHVNIEMFINHLYEKEDYRGVVSLLRRYFRIDGVFKIDTPYFHSPSQVWRKGYIENGKIEGVLFQYKEGELENTQFFIRGERVFFSNSSLRLLEYNGKNLYFDKEHEAILLELLSLKKILLKETFETNTVSVRRLITNDGDIVLPRLPLR
jgi:hypothetical protein